MFHLFRRMFICFIATCFRQFHVVHQPPPFSELLSVLVIASGETSGKARGYKPLQTWTRLVLDAFFETYLFFWLSFGKTKIHLSYEELIALPRSLSSWAWQPPQTQTFTSDLFNKKHPRSVSMPLTPNHCPPPRFKC